MAALLGLALAGCGPDSTRCGVERGDGAQTVTIPSGSSFAAAADSLARTGVVKHARFFRLYAKLRGRERALKAGVYLFDCDLAEWPEVLRRLETGPIEREITIPEGFALAEIVPLLARTLGARPDSVRAAVRDTALLHALNVPTPTLEGYLFPDTYRFTVLSSPRDAVRQMVRQFESKWDPSWNAQLQKLAMTRHDIITLASIIEKEARLAEERPVISAVYHNRLRDQMPLQADPTVQYARGEHTERVLYKDLEISSPYNTYRNKGLPPGPIASPGRASVEAALFPADVPYKFFVAHPDGHHEFRRTFKEHTDAIRQVRSRTQPRRK
ncbi:MAG: endolytic transglycosylase MltG [Anaerolineae bacterium]|nr:endolytic transglycosylase MltG [Gemmatimonadaceae bacterium]